MDSRAVRHFIRQYGSRDAVATLGDKSLSVREGRLFCRAEDEGGWRPACTRCFVRHKRCRVADSRRPPRFRLCIAHARKHLSKKRRLAGSDSRVSKKRRLAGSDSRVRQKHRRPNTHSAPPVSSAVRLWLQRLATAEPFVEKKAGVRMLQQYGAAFRVIADERLVFKEWRAGHESPDRPACESCYEHENLATVATVARDREWPTVCARHATPADPAQSSVSVKRAKPKKSKEQQESTPSSPTVKRKFMCDQCEARFSKSGDLKRHLRVHSGEKPFACPECEARFSESGHLQRHLRVHSGEKPFACPECEARFSQSGSLKRHLRMHSGEKPFACPECEARFSESGTLKRHLRVHSGEKPFACPECEARFSESGTLKTHLRVHSGEKPFACPECEARFSTSGTLKAHLRTHSGEKPFACPECEARFSQSGNLKSHLRTHSGEKPFACLECEARFSASGHLRRHERRHEESEKWQHVCTFASFSTAKFQTGQGLLQCTTRCKTERVLDDHVQRCHTEEGIAQRFRSEQQLAEFLAGKGWAFDRDFANAIFYKHCDAKITPQFAGAVSSRPDFHLLGFQSLPAERRCLVLLCNDEFAHRRYRCELGRMLKISTALGANPSFRDLPIIYIRFNPHWFEVDGVLHDPPLAARFERLQQLLLDLQGGRVPGVASRRAALSLLYLYYDRQTTAATAAPWQRLAGDLYSAGPDTGDGNSEVALALRDCVVLVE